MLKFNDKNTKLIENQFTVNFSFISNQIVTQKKTIVIE